MKTCLGCPTRVADWLIDGVYPAILAALQWCVGVVLLVAILVVPIFVFKLIWTALP